KFPGQTTWVEVPTILPDSGDVTHHPFTGEAAHLIDCIQSGRESHASVADAFKTHAVCFAADESGRTGRPVAVPASYATRGSVRGGLGVLCTAFSRETRRGSSWLRGVCAWHSCPTSSQRRGTCVRSRRAPQKLASWPLVNCWSFLPPESTCRWAA